MTSEFERKKLNFKTNQVTNSLPHTWLEHISNYRCNAKFAYVTFTSADCMKVFEQIRRLPDIASRRL